MKLCLIRWPMHADDSLGLVKYLLLNGQYIHLNNYCLATKWMQKGKSLRYRLKTRPIQNKHHFSNQILVIDHS